MLRSQLLIIDASSQLRPNYEALKDGPPESRAERACSTTVNQFRRLLAELPHTHAVAVFDTGGPNWRHAIDPAYKANRPPTPPDLLAALPGLMVRLREHLQLAAVSVDGYEADDVIATLSRRFVEIADGASRIVTADKDLCALIDAYTEIYSTKTRSVIWRPWVLERFGVEPYQLTDYLALVGDRTDGIAGVPGIGPKGAAALLNRYPTLDSMLESAADDTAQVRAHAEIARRSRALATLRCDAPLQLGLRDLRRGPPGPARAVADPAMAMASP